MRIQGARRRSSQTASAAPRPTPHLARLHVFYRHVARDPASFDLRHRVLGVPVKRAPRRAVHYLEREDLDAILRGIDRSTPAGRCDYAMLAFAYQTGARVEEAVSLRACPWTSTCCRRCACGARGARRGSSRSGPAPPPSCARGWRSAASTRAAPRPSSSTSAAGPSRAGASATC